METAPLLRTVLCFPGHEAPYSIRMGQKSDEDGKMDQASAPAPADEKESKLVVKEKKKTDGGMWNLVPVYFC